MITVAQYFGGRREKYPTSYTPQIGENAARTVALLNELLIEAERDGVFVLPRPDDDSTPEGLPAKPGSVPAPVNPAGDFKGSQLNSGWRPPAVNATTPGASKTSRHMTGEGADLRDPDGRLDRWLMTPRGQQVMTRLGLWLEHPDSTPGWAHLQTKPPASGNRVFRIK